MALKKKERERYRKGLFLNDGFTMAWLKAHAKTGNALAQARTQDRGLEDGGLLGREVGSSCFPEGCLSDSPLRIEEELGDEARFAGHNFRNPSVL